MGLYRYEFRSLAGNVMMEEVALADVQFTRALNETGTFSAKFPLGDPGVQIKDPYQLTTPCHSTITVYRGEVPVWGGIIWTRKYDSASQMLDVGAADWWSYFDHRRVLPVLPPSPDTTVVAPLSTVYSAVEQNDIARGLVTLAQSHTAGDIGIELDTTTSAITRDRTYWGYQLAEVGEALRQLTGVIDGPDIVFGVGAPSGTDGKPRRLMRVGTPDLGQQGAPWVFEYGANISSYTWPSDGTRMATRVLAVGDGTEQAMPIAVSEDTSKYEFGWPLLESDSSYTSVTDMATLQSHADADQRIARLPVALPELTIRGDAEPTFGTYSEGDWARVIIRDCFFTGTGLDTTMRIVRMAVSPGDAGEEVTLTMTPLLEDVA